MTQPTQTRSWVASAQRAGADFPIQNLPFASFRRQGSSDEFVGGVAIGDQILDLIANRHWSPCDRSIDVLVGKLRRKLGLTAEQLRCERPAVYSLSDAGLSIVLSRGDAA